MKKAQVIQAILSLKHPFGVIVAMSVCAYAMLKGLQLVAIAAFVALLLIVYRGRVRYCLSLLTFVVSRARAAKYKDMEIELTNGYPLPPSGRVYSMYLAHAQPWVQIMAAQLYGHEIGLVLRLYREKKMLCAEFKAEDLDDLHRRGLVCGNAASLFDSEAVQLTELGIAFAEALLKLEPRTTQPDGQVTPA